MEVVLYFDYCDYIKALGWDKVFKKMCRWLWVGFTVTAPNTCCKSRAPRTSEAVSAFLQASPRCLCVRRLDASKLHKTMPSARLPQFH